MGAFLTGDKEKSIKREGLSKLKIFSCALKNNKKVRIHIFIEWAWKTRISQCKQLSRQSIQRLIGIKLESVKRLDGIFSSYDNGWDE